MKREPHDEWLRKHEPHMQRHFLSNSMTTNATSLCGRRTGYFTNEPSEVTCKKCIDFISRGRRWTCNTCKLPLDESCFYRHGSHGKYRTQCKECMKAADRTRRLQHPAHCREIKKRWYETHKEEITKRCAARSKETAVYQRAYYLRNREKLAAQSRAYHLKNRDHLNQKKRQWYEDNKEGIAKRYAARKEEIASYPHSISRRRGSS